MYLRQNVLFSTLQSANSPLTEIEVVSICDRVRGNRAYVGEIDIEIQAKTVGTICFVEVVFICLKFRVGIVESCQEV